MYENNTTAWGVKHPCFLLTLVYAWWNYFEVHFVWLQMLEIQSNPIITNPDRASYGIYIDQMKSVYENARETYSLQQTAYLIYRTPCA